jgi:putative transposase
MTCPVFASIFFGGRGSSVCQNVSGLLVERRRSWPRREAPRIEVDTSLPAERIVRALEELIELRGRPQKLRMDNGPELISDKLAKWADRHRVELLFIQPGKPMQNGCIERFNRTYREEVLNAYVFETLGEVRRMTAAWLVRYNEQRPHESLGDLSRRQYLMAISTKPSTSDWS